MLISRKGLIGTTKLSGTKGMQSHRVFQNSDVVPAIEIVFDFENNRYTENGVPVELSDISEFIRLSSATKWQDGKLVEVANNVPRISGDGLLIEPQRTNNLTNAVLTNGAAEGTSPPLIVEYVNSAFAQFTSISTRFDFQPYTAAGYTSSRGRFSDSRATLVNGENYNISFYVSHNSVNTHYDGSISVYAVGTTASPTTALNKETTGQSNIRYSRAWTHEQISGYVAPAVFVGSAIGSEVVSVSINAVQIEFGDISSFIPTTSSPVTRSPDILNIPLLPTQTITGDWDADVTYSVADGIATFTGHGYIRNITVEEL